MIRRLVLLILALFVVSASGAQAQNIFSEGEHWYFGWDVDSESSILYAFNLDGELRNLGELQEPRVSWRIDSQRFLIFIENESDTLDVAIISPDDVNIMAGGFEEPYMPVSYHDPYLVMRPVSPRRVATPMLFIDVENGTVEELMTASMLDTPACCRFSMYGTQMRYLSRTDDDENDRLADFELRERDLQTGVETVLYTANANEERFFTFTSSIYGDQWVVRDVDLANDRTETFTLLDFENEDVQLSQSRQGDVQYRIFSDYLMRSNPLCDVDCSISLTHLQTGIEKTFLLDNEMTGFTVPIYANEDTLIVNIGGQRLFQISEDGPPLSLGYYLPINMGPDYVSPDGRWSVLLDEEDEPGAMFIRDHNNDRSLQGRVNLPDPVWILTRFVGDHIIIWDTRPEGGYYTFNTRNGNQVSWPVIPRVIMQAIISNEEALIGTSGTDDLDEGVYLLNRQPEEFTLLVPQFLAIYDGLSVEEFARRSDR